MYRSLSALDSLVGELNSLEAPKAVRRPTKTVAKTVTTVSTAALPVDIEEYYLESDSHDTKVAKLKAKIAELKQAKDDVATKFSPSLRRRVPIRKLMEKHGTYLRQTVGVGAWIRTTRKFKGGLFVQLFDGTSAHQLQVIVSESLPNFEEIFAQGVGASLFVVGEIIPSVGAGQAVEMNASEVRILGECDPTIYPLAGKRFTLEYLRALQHFRPRSAIIGAVMRIRNTLAFATHEFFQNGGYMYVHTPLITASDCEGAGEMFQVTTLVKDGDFTDKLSDGKADLSKDFFKKRAGLTVSGQLNGEIYAHAFSSIYTFGPTFRAENSMTKRHLAEFWMIEPEIAFADLKENADVAEAYLKACLHAALTKNAPDLAILEDFEIRTRASRAEEEAKANEKKPPKKQDKQEAAKSGKQEHWADVPLRKRLHSIINSQFARVTYTEAIEILQQVESSGHVFEEKVVWGMDMGSEHERYLCERHFMRPTIVMNYPKDIKSFYMRLNEDNKTVAAMDVLVPGVGEIIGGSQREERLEVLERRIKEVGMKVEDYSWYLDLRRYGSVPHAGFGAGFGRLVCYATGMEHIRDVIPFPRYPGHCDY